MIEITKDNYKNYIGKIVQVEICCYEYGIVHPEINFLLDFNENKWKFLSYDDHEEWLWNENDTGNCSVFICLSDVDYNEGLTNNI